MKGSHFRLGREDYEVISDPLVVRGEDGLDDVMLMVKRLSNNMINCIPYSDIETIWSCKESFYSAHKEQR